MHRYSDTPHEAFIRQYDANGNYTGGGGTALAIGYDVDNQMTSYATPGNLETYRYDASNRRVSTTRNGVTTYYLYLGDRVLEEYAVTGGGALVWAADYVYGNYVDEVLLSARDFDGNGLPDETYYYHTDDQWNVAALTDSLGDVVERYLYDDFGAPTVTDVNWVPLATNASTVSNTRLFQGRDYEWSTQLYHYRARYMEPATGRFTTRDPIGIWGDVLHLGNGYTFLNNNPWSLIDPFGLKAGSNRKLFIPLYIAEWIAENIVASSNLVVSSMSGTFTLDSQAIIDAAIANAKLTGAVISNEGAAGFGNALREGWDNLSLRGKTHLMADIITVAIPYSLNKLSKLNKLKNVPDVDTITPEARSLGADAKRNPGFSEEVIERKTPGLDGGKSQQVIERDPDGNAISRTHTVTKESQIVHQHQNSIGKYGGERQFPDEWTGTETINAPYENRPPSG